jgi:hypothetical protein
MLDKYLNKIEKKESLSEIRYKEAMRRKYRTPYSKENTEVDSSEIIGESSLTVPAEEATEDIGDSEERSEESDGERSEEKYFGKDVVIKPLAYYTLEESLRHALNDYKDQIKRTTDLVMAKRAKLGQKAATEQNKKDVLGEYPERNTTTEVVPETVSTGFGLKLKRHYYTRPINGIMYRIIIDECPVGIGQTRRNTYMLVDIAVIFYRKNGIGLGKEIILRSKVLRFRKRAPHSAT